MLLEWWLVGLWLKCRVRPGRDLRWMTGSHQDDQGVQQLLLLAA